MKMTCQTYEDGDTVTYRYDNDGALATVTDSATGKTTIYYYDFIDRLVKYEETFAATCMKLGCTPYTCACGESYTGNYVTALGHNYVNNVLFKGYLQ